MGHMAGGIIMKKRSSYFYKILLLFFTTVFATSFLLTLFSYHQLSDSLFKKAYADYQAGLRKNFRTLENLSSEMGQLRSAITVDPQTEAFFSMRRFDPIQEYYTYLKVKKLFNIHPYMECFCLYNPSIDYALYCGTDAIDLKGLWEKIRDRNGEITVSSLRTDSGQPLLVFGYPVYIDTFDQPQGAVFLCLDGEMASAHVLGQTSYGQLVLDAKGEVLLQQAGPEAESLINQLPLEEMETFDGIYTVDGSRFLCSFYRANGLTFLSYVNYTQVTEPLQHQRNIFLLVCLCVMAGSGLLQFFAVKKLYRPIASIKEVFEQSSFADGTAREEFGLIRQVYEGALQQIQSLEEKNALNLPRIKAEILKGLLTGGLTVQQGMERLQENGWEVDFSGMFLVDIFIDEIPEDGLLSSLLQARLRQLMTEKLGDSFLLECIPMGNGEMAGLLNTRGESAVTFDDLVKALEAIRDELLREYQISMTIGLDGFLQGAEDCNRFYTRVRQLQKNRFALGENQIIYPARIQTLLPEPLAWPDKLMQDILMALKGEQKEQYQEKVEDFLETICQYVYEASSLLFARLYLDIVGCIMQYGAAEKSSVFTVNMKTDPETRQEARLLLTAAYDVYVGRSREAEKLKSNKHYKKIQEGQQFILEHFSDCTLNVDRIAEQLGYSTNYFSRLFKSITGYYINDYIRQVRIMKAQELLVGTDMTVGEIAEAVGYTTANYFYSIFKKETGMTPAAYRNSAEE